jgi:photosystem II stability/assembly factor-like uncharacterized protein
MSPSDTLVLGTRKGLLVLERNGGGWKTVRHAHPGQPVAYAAADARTGSLWACLDHGHWGQKLQRSGDMGDTWEEVPAPKYPEGAEIMKGFPGGEQHRKQATLRYLWVFAPGGTDQPGRIYLGTEPGALFRSDDNGESFALVDGLWNHPSRLTSWFGGGRDTPGIHSIMVDPRDSRRLLVGISCAGVFETVDDGATWTPRNQGLKAEFLPDPDAEVGHDPHFATWCPIAPDVLWQQNHCGVFRSTDGARSWRKISQEGGPAHFGFPIAADPVNPSTAWVVPATSDEVRTAVNGALCVSRTDDGGETWTAFRAGLPQEGCYDVAFRHALDVSGTRLAFGTTTGNVYLSDDRAESWQCLGNDFPPVYSVRFA